MGNAIDYSIRRRVKTLEAGILGWTAVPLAANFANGVPAPEVCVDATGMAFLRGSVVAGSSIPGFQYAGGKVFATLPVAARPSVARGGVAFNSTSDGTGRLAIAANGQLSFVTAGIGQDAVILLDGVTYST